MDLKLRSMAEDWHRLLNELTSTYIAVLTRYNVLQLPRDFDQGVSLCREEALIETDVESYALRPDINIDEADRYRQDIYKYHRAEMDRLLEKAKKVYDEFINILLAI